MTIDQILILSGLAGVLIGSLYFFIGSIKDKDSLVISSFILISLSFIVFMIGINNKSEKEEFIEFNIASLERDKHLNGSFFLGIGHLGEDIVYYVYKVIDKDEYKLVRLPLLGKDLPKLIETNKVKPKYRFVKKCYYNFLFKYCKVIENALYVPKGTIMKDFKG